MLYKMQPNIKLAGVVLLPIVLVLAFGTFTNRAEAGRLQAKIYMTQEKIPRRVSEKELIAFAKKNQSKRISETTEANVKERKWRANLVIAFNSSLGTLEFELVYYDVQKGVRIEIERESTILSDKTQKTYIQRIKLQRPKYQPNRKMLLAVVVNGQEVGKVNFSTVGQQ